METLLNFPREYKQTKLKTLPLRDQPAYRVASNANGCNLAELLAAVVGGAQQIEVAEGLLSRFGGDIQRMYKANVAEIAQVHGIGQQTAVRIRAALTLGIRLHEPTGEPAFHVEFHVRQQLLRRRGRPGSGQQRDHPPQRSRSGSI